MNDRMRGTLEFYNTCNQLNAMAGLARYRDPALAELLLRSQIQIMELLDETGRKEEIETWYEQDRFSSNVILSLFK